MLFVGEYEQGVVNGRLTLPQDIRNRRSWWNEELDATLGPLWVSMPGPNDQVWLWPMERFRLILSYAKEVHVDPDFLSHSCQWSQRVRQLAREFTLRPGCAVVPPREHPSSVRAGLRVLSEILAEQDLDRSSNLKGHDLERFAADVLADAGCQVQLRLRLGGGEIDLLGFGYTHDGRPGYLLVECKHYADRPVSVSEVRSLFGLREIVKEQIPLLRTVLVSSSGFSPSAHNLAKLWDMDLLDHGALSEWAHSVVRHPDLPVIPIHHISREGARGTISVPFATSRFLGGTTATVLGVRDRVELRSPREWLIRKAQQYEDFLAMIEMVKQRQRNRGGEGTDDVR